DIKAPLSKYSYITNKLSDTDIIKESINLILNSKIDYEFRTTVVKSQLSFEDFDEIGQLIKGAKKYFLQKFEVHSQIYDESLNHQKSYSDEEFKVIINILNKYIKHVQVR
ncbi:MAG: hypothetical protein LUG16_03055, partial [Candidatus Gastranaerophilales bacterium]|nr:hypothetical protein [Candidatus Gastranaerophilales bacterium]